MKLKSDFKKQFKKASKLHASGRFADAEKHYLQLAMRKPHRSQVLKALYDLYLHTKRNEHALRVLHDLTYEEPTELSYFVRLAAVLEEQGQTEAAIDHYQRFISKRPKRADAHFNVALLYKKLRKFTEAEAAYLQAIALGISSVEEVYSNLGVLYSEMDLSEKAEASLLKALEIDPNYIPGLFNLAGYHEEFGRKEKATKLYERIIELDPRRWDALCRLAYAKRLTSANEDLLDKLRTSLNDHDNDPQAQESIYFALGKANDDLKEYQAATIAYQRANRFNAKHHPPYNAKATEAAIDRLISLFDAGWLKQAQLENDADPVFVCGLYRSGSTLIEQVLSASDQLTSGGELEALPFLIGKHLSPYPQGVVDASRDQLKDVAARYQQMVSDRFPGAKRVIDKRPDNFLHLGLILSLFPQAKIIHSERNPLDICISVYFQQLGPHLRYANEMEHIAHYISQQRRLMAHWKTCFPQSIFTLRYEDLIESPETTLKKLCEGLGIAYDEKMLKFYAQKHAVKTASLWQVREKLHSRSKDRWRNYPELVEPLKKKFAEYFV